MRNLVVAITILTAAGVAGAVTTTSYTTQPMAGGTAYDITLSSDVDWTNSRITVELTSGSLIDPHAFNFHYTGFNDNDTWVDAAAADDMATSVIVNTLEGNEVLDWSWYDTTSDGAQTWLAARIIVASEGTITLQNFDAGAPGIPQECCIQIPEPATLALLGFGAFGVLLRRRR